jgi:flagellar basal-body rod modification protein FlgD
MIGVATTMPATVTTLPMGTQLPSTNSSAAATGANSTSSANSTLTQNDFLTLLTTQLENQDPLNPQNPSDFAAELAQFSTASGVQSLNTTMTANAGLQAASLVGQNVAVAGNQLVLGSKGTALGAFSLSGPASDVTVSVVNSSGSVVNTIDLGAMSTGNQSFTWNGQDSNGNAQTAGTYGYTINATAPAGSTVTATSYAVAPVTAVVMGGQSGTMLNLGGGLAPVALSAVQEVF